MSFLYLLSISPCSTMQISPAVYQFIAICFIGIFYETVASNLVFFLSNKVIGKRVSPLDSRAFPKGACASYR